MDLHTHNFSFLFFSFLFPFFLDWNGLGYTRSIDLSSNKLDISQAGSRTM